MFCYFIACYFYFLRGGCLYIGCITNVLNWGKCNIGTMLLNSYLDVAYLITRLTQLMPDDICIYYCTE